MKQLILVLFLTFFMVGCSISSLYQSEVGSKDQEIKGLHNALSTYTDATINNEIDTLITFVYPKVFTIVSPDKMIFLLQKMYNSGKAPKITEIKHKNISDIYHYDQGVYSIISSDMHMELKSPVVNNPEYEMFLYMMLKKHMGSNSVIDFDRNKHLYRIKKDSKIIGINESNQGWKFVGYEQAKKYASRDIIPKQIVRNLK